MSDGTGKPLSAAAKRAAARRARILAKEESRMSYVTEEPEFYIKSYKGYGKEAAAEKMEVEEEVSARL